MISALYLIYAVLILTEGILAFLFWFRFKHVTLLSIEDLPEVTVLVCARDEEHNLRDCLDALGKLNYPLDSIEVLIGNDNSEDRTEDIIKEYETDFKFMKGFSILHEKDGLIAKANVLSQLIDESNYQYQVIIDADMVVTDDWLRYMVSALVAGNDMVSGYTQVQRSSWLANLQFMDWQNVLHSMKVMADSIRPISILGNNMAFKKDAYDKVGGFRGLGPTDVEDLGLLQRFHKQGFKTIQLADTFGEASTKPQLTFNELITQRCRWMNGVFTHHFVLGIPALFARLWVLFAATTLFFEPKLSLLIVGYGLLLSWLKSRSMTSKTRSNSLIFILEPIIISLLDTLALFRLIFVGKVSWKGRKH